MSDDKFEHELETVASVQAMRPENYEYAVSDFKAGARWARDLLRDQSTSKSSVRENDSEVDRLRQEISNLQVELFDCLDAHNKKIDELKTAHAEIDRLKSALNHPTSERHGHLIRERDEARAEIKDLVEAMSQARQHCGWAQTQDIVQNARYCAYEAWKVLDTSLTKYEEAKKCEK